MSIDVFKFYDDCLEIGGFSEQNGILLDKIMNISNPMDFNDDFANDEELDNLEQELDRVYSRDQNIDGFRGIFEDLKPIKSSFVTFI